MSTQNIISFQGAKGAYSDLACRAMYPDMETLPCSTFDLAFQAVIKRDAEYAMIPVDNTLAGRVADVHHLIPKSGLHIVGEHLQPIHHNLLGVKGTKIEDIQTVHSHIHAIPQCKGYLKKLNVQTNVQADTAGAARNVSEIKDKTQAAIASTLAAELYDLEILDTNIEDADHNTTRFLVFSRKPRTSFPDKAHLKTSFTFEVRNIPAALYKALGGFATNNVQMTKLESYVGAEFKVAFFYADVIGHPEEDDLKLALEELTFFAKDMKILGTYPAYSK
ncbi:MAG: prephenate dehydratase [Alphaproteobacteria bacterium]|nr:prephenate dehydratase [Alphaproteobacteria bacterium]